MRLIVVALVAGMMAGGGFLLLDVTEADAPAPAQEHVVQVCGGTISYSSALQGGERFLERVPLPEHLANPYEPVAEEETPGDGHDDDLLVTQRRHTDHSWWTKPVTGIVEIFNVNCTAENPVCICDTEFVFSNESGIIPGQSLIDVRYSSHILFDNITAYGGGIYFDRSQFMTVSRSQFISSNIDAMLGTDVLIWDNDFYTDEGPVTAVESDPLIENPTGIHNCWPNPNCLRSGLRPSVAARWTVMWNYFDSGGPGGTGFGFADFHIEHNTILNSMNTMAGFGGHNVVKWNLIRGFGYAGIDIGGDTCLVENNTIVLAFALYPLREVILQYPGVHVWNPCEVRIRYNDLVGYGTQIFEVHRGGAPALWNSLGKVTANDNYWGTVHDPKVPPKRWILTSDKAETIVDRWFIQPIHDIAPIVYGLNAQDRDRWLDEASKRVHEIPDHAVAWAEDQLPVT